MKSQTIPVGELIYQADLQFTNFYEYGVSMEALTSGKVSIPPEGARFDQVFVGELRGPKLRGRISGTDYLYVRADGLFQLHLHARVTTDDGANISLSSEGISLQTEGKKETQLRTAVSLFTGSETYRWLNKLQLWAMGAFDVANGKAVIKAYSF
jgi:hypothetical protein